MLIGLAGKAGVGKDTIAKIIQKHTGCRIVSFADPLRKACSNMFGWDIDELKSMEFKETVDPEWGFTPRRALQLLGTEFGRNLDPDLWVKLLGKEIGDDSAVIPDVRFENEAEWIRSKGGEVIHIWGNQIKTTSENQHVSESGIEVGGELIFINPMNGLDKLEKDVVNLLLLLQLI